VPYVFNSFLPLTCVVRTAADLASLIARIRAEAAAMDLSLPRSRTASARLPAIARSAGAKPNTIAATHAAPAVYLRPARQARL
jgi:hypothetical protein